MCGVAIAERPVPSGGLSTGVDTSFGALGKRVAYVEQYIDSRILFLLGETRKKFSSARSMLRKLDYSQPANAEWLLAWQRMAARDYADTERRKKEFLAADSARCSQVAQQLEKEAQRQSAAVLSRHQFQTIYSPGSVPTMVCSVCGTTSLSAGRVCSPRQRMVPTQGSYVPPSKPVGLWGGTPIDRRSNFSIGR
jgi:predicted nucleic acid-binding Zn ribbon protein